MRTISGQTLTLLQNKEQIESVLIVAINFGSGWQYYADKTIPTSSTGLATSIPGKVIELAGIDSVTRIDGQGQSSQVSITLDDTDGTIKNIMNNVDVHLKPVQVLQWFDGMPWSEKFLVLSGCLSSPIVWDEGKRTIGFDVVSKLESYEIGFSADEGNFKTIPYPLIGAPWPMVFGQVIHAPTLQLQEIPSAFTLAGFGVPDPTLLYEIGRLGIHMQQCKNAANLCLFYAAMACYGLYGAEGDPQDCNNDSTVQSFNQQSVQYQEAAQSDQLKIEELQNTLTQQHAVPNYAPLYPSTYVEQPFSGLMRVGSQMFQGHLNMNSGRVGGQPFITKNIEVPTVINPDAPGVVPKQIAKEGFLWFPAGTQVAICDNYPIQYMVSMIPGTVNAVYAYRNVNGVRSLATVPPKYYDVVSLNYNSPIGAAVIVQVKMPLSCRGYLEQQEINTWENNYGSGLPQHVTQTIDWEDTLYVNFTSSVGPNAVDIMEWVISHYCPGLAIDSTSFNYVKGKVGNYPMNFSYAQRPEAVKFLQDIAYQARCAIWIENDTFYLKYLPEMGTSVDTLTLDDIIVGSLQLTCTPTEELITKYIATWRPDYLPAYQDPIESIYRFNVNKYGTHAESYDYFAYSGLTYVEKTATFWMIRKSMTWKILKAKLFIRHLNLETFDTVTLNLPSGLLATGPVKAMITKSTYNSDDNSIDVEFWTEVRMGEMTPYPLAWPAGATEADYFPTYRDLQAGSGGGLNGGMQGTLPPGNSQQAVGQPQYPDRGGAGDQTDDNSPANPANQQKPTWEIGPPGLYSTGSLAYGDPFPADAGDIVVPLAVRSTPDLDNSPEPTFTYDYNDLTDVKVTDSAPTLQVIPARIENKDDQESSDGYQTYTVTAYPQGLSSTGVTLSGVKQMQIDKDDEIPPGTACHVVMNLVYDSDTNSKQRELSMQVPVWLQ